MADGTDISVGAGIEGVGTGEESPSQAKIQERPPAYASTGAGRALPPKFPAADADQDRVPNLISLPGVASGAHEDFLVAQLAGGQTPAPPSHSLSHSQPSFSRSSSFRNSSSFRVRAAADSEDSSPSTTTTTSPTGRGISVPEQPSSGPISGPAGGILPVLTRDFPSPTDEEVKEFCLATGGGYGACDADERFVIGGEWRHEIKRRANWLSMERMVVRSTSLEASQITPDMFARREQEAELTFHRPEGCEQGHFRDRDAAGMQRLRSVELSQEVRRQVRGDFVVELRTLRRCPRECKRIEIQISVDSDMALETESARCRVELGRSRAAQNATAREGGESRNLLLEVVLKQKGGEAKRVSSMHVRAQMESASGEVCDLQLSGTKAHTYVLGPAVMSMDETRSVASKLHAAGVCVDVRAFRGDDAPEDCYRVIHHAARLKELLFVGSMAESQLKPSRRMKQWLGGDQNNGVIHFREGKVCFDYAILEELAGHGCPNTAFGRLTWRDNEGVEPASFTRVDAAGMPGWHESNPLLIRFLMERVWGLKKPNLVLSVAGAANDLSLDAKKKERLLLGLVDAAKALDAWIVTAGLSAGITRLVGEARAKFAVSVPLVAIASWGTVMGRHRLLHPMADHTTRQHLHMLPVEDYQGAAKEHLRRHHSSTSSHHSGIGKVGSSGGGGRRKGSVWAAIERERERLDRALCQTIKRERDAAHTDNITDTQATEVAKMILEGNDHDLDRADSGAAIETLEDLDNSLGGGGSRGASRGEARGGGEGNRSRRKVAEEERGRERAAEEAGSVKRAQMSFVFSKTGRARPPPIDQACERSGSSDGDDHLTALQKSPSNANLPPLSPMSSRQNSMLESAKGLGQLDKNHSHFLLAHDGTTGLYQREVKLRAHLEACLSKADTTVNDVLDSLKRQGLGWQGIDMREERAQRKRTPTVCVCLQGGSGTVATVLQAVLNDTPVLLVRGTGGATDLMSDLVTLKYGTEHNKQLPIPTENQRLLTQLIQMVSNSTLSSNSSMEALKDYRAVIAALDNPDSTCEHMARAIAARYFEQLPSANLSNMLARAMEVADHDMCWIYDLNSEDSMHDFSGCLLKCILHGQGRTSRRDDEKQLEDDLAMIITWNRRDILGHVLSRAVSTMKGSLLQGPLNKALHEAILGNRVELARQLLNYGADLRQYSLNEATVLGVDHNRLPGLDREDALEQMDAANRWLKLTKVHKQDPMGNYMFSFLIPFRHASGADSFIEWMQGRVAGLGQVLWVLKKRYMRLTIDGREIKKIVGGRRASLGGYLPGLGVALVPSMELQWIRVQKALIKLKWLYKDLLGARFEYEIGMGSPQLDLLLWSVLANRQEMALLFWQLNGSPVQSALTTCLLYRKMASRSEVEPVIQRKMLDSARHFEKIATGVQLAAMEQDMVQAMEALELPLQLWSGGATSLDLAIWGGCMNFVESCCREALDRRFCGDLHPYGQHIGPLRGGCKRAVFLSLFTGGFIAPYLLKFVPPPSAQNLRFSTQCRKMPEGYPYHPMNNPVLSAMFLRHKERRALSKRESKSVSWIMALQHAREAGLVKLGHDQLNELWGPTFSFWEKWSCFWRAPVTIYLANVMVQVAITSFFTRFLTSQTEPQDHVEPFEVFMIIYFASSTFTELVQVIIDGIGTYLPDFWNVIDMVALFFFWLGLAFRLQCINRHCDDLYAWTYRDPLYGELEGPKVNGFSKMFYSVSLFCLWTRLLRVLSVDKTLGPLVLVFRRMGRDTLIFGVMWMVFLMAFSVALHGSGIEPDPTTCAEGGMKASCWETWWIVRTYFQSFGEPFFSEMNSDASMLGLMICWIVMNIILVNLLIARMSSTYSRIEKQSEKEWMFDLYLATKEYMRLTASIPIPFNIVPLIIDISLFFLKRLRADKYGGRGHVAETLANHLSRNNSGAPSPALLARLKFRRDQLAAQQDRGTEHDQSLRQELERMSRLLLTEEGRRMRENRELLRLNAYIERARAAFIQTGTESGGSSRLEHLEGKVNQLMGVLQNHLDPLRGALLTSEGSEDAESVQLMREKSTHSLRGW